MQEQQWAVIASRQRAFFRQSLSLNEVKWLKWKSRMTLLIYAKIMCSLALWHCSDSDGCCWGWTVSFCARRSPCPRRSTDLKAGELTMRKEYPEYPSTGLGFSTSMWMHHVSERLRTSPNALRVSWPERIGSVPQASPGRFCAQSMTILKGAMPAMPVMPVLPAMHITKSQYNLAWDIKS